MLSIFSLLSIKTKKKSTFNQFDSYSATLSLELQDILTKLDDKSIETLVDKKSYLSENFPVIVRQLKNDDSLCNKFLNNAKFRDWLLQFRVDFILDDQHATKKGTILHYLAMQSEQEAIVFKKFAQALPKLIDIRDAEGQGILHLALAIGNDWVIKSIGECFPQQFLFPLALPDALSQCLTPRDNSGTMQGNFRLIHDKRGGNYPLVWNNQSLQFLRNFPTLFSYHLRGNNNYAVRISENKKLRSLVEQEEKIRVTWYLESLYNELIDNFEAHEVEKQDKFTQAADNFFSLCLTINLENYTQQNAKLINHYKLACYLAVKMQRLLLEGKANKSDKCKDIIPCPNSKQQISAICQKISSLMLVNGIIIANKNSIEKVEYLEKKSLESKSAEQPDLLMLIIWKIIPFYKTITTANPLETLERLFNESYQAIRGLQTKYSIKLLLNAIKKLIPYFEKSQIPVVNFYVFQLFSDYLQIEMNGKITEENLRELLKEISPIFVANNDENSDKGSLSVLICEKVALFSSYYLQKILINYHFLNRTLSRPIENNIELVSFDSLVEQAIIALEKGEVELTENVAIELNKITKTYYQKSISDSSEKLAHIEKVLVNYFFAKIFSNPYRGPIILKFLLSLGQEFCQLYDNFIDLHMLTFINIILNHPLIENIKVFNSRFSMCERALLEDIKKLCSLEKNYEYITRSMSVLDNSLPYFAIFLLWLAALKEAEVKPVNNSVNEDAVKKYLNYLRGLGNTVSKYHFIRTTVSNCCTFPLSDVHQFIESYQMVDEKFFYSQKEKLNSKDKSLTKFICFYEQNRALTPLVEKSLLVLLFRLHLQYFQIPQIRINEKKWNVEDIFNVLFKVWFLRYSFNVKDRITRAKEQFSQDPSSLQNSQYLAQIVIEAEEFKKNAHNLVKTFDFIVQINSAIPDAAKLASFKTKIDDLVEEVNKLLLNQFVQKKNASSADAIQKKSRGLSSLFLPDETELVISTSQGNLNKKKLFRPNSGRLTMRLRSRSQTELAKAADSIDQSPHL